MILRLEKFDNKDINIFKKNMLVLSYIHIYFNNFDTNLLQGMEDIRSSYSIVTY